MRDRFIHGNERRVKLEHLQRSRPRRTSLHERYRDLCGGDSAGSDLRVYGRRRGRFSRRLLILSDADVRVARDSWSSGGRYLALFSLCSEKASRARFGNRRISRRGHHGGRVFSRTRLFVQHARICAFKAAVSDFAGGGRRGRRHAFVPQVRAEKAVCEIFR